MRNHKLMNQIQQGKIKSGSSEDSVWEKLKKSRTRKCQQKIERLKHLLHYSQL